MDLPPSVDPRGASRASAAGSVEARELAELREGRRLICAGQAAEVKRVARIVQRCRADAMERVFALGDVELDMAAEVFAHRQAVDSVMCALGVGKNEATRLVNLADRLAVLPAVWEAWSAGVLDTFRVRVLADATDVLDGATARAVAHQVLAVHAEKSDIAMADQVISDLARAWPATDPDGVRLSMDQRRADAFIGLLRAVRDGSLADRPANGDADGGSVEGSAFAHAPGLPRVALRRVHDLGLVLHADTLFGDGPAADATAQLRGLGRPDVVDPDSARTLARKQLRDGTAVQVLVVDDTGAVEHVVRLDKDTAQSCGSREALVEAVREQLAAAPPLEVDTHDPSEAIARHVRAAAPTCSFYDCPRQARSCDLDHDTPWPRGPTSVTNLDPKCRRHHNAKTLGIAQTRLMAGPGTGPRTVRWTLPAGIQVTTTPEPLLGTRLSPTPTPTPVAG